MTSEQPLPDEIYEGIVDAVLSGYRDGLRLGDSLPLATPGYELLRDFGFDARIGQREVQGILNGNTSFDRARYGRLGKEMGEAVLSYILFGRYQNGQDNGLLDHPEVPDFESDDPPDWTSPEGLIGCLTTAIPDLPNYGLGDVILISGPSSGLREWSSDYQATPLEFLQDNYTNFYHLPASDLDSGQLLLLRSHESMFRVHAEPNSGIPAPEGVSSRGGPFRISFRLAVRLDIRNPSGVLRIEM